MQLAFLGYNTYISKNPANRRNVMPEEENKAKKNPAENFADMFKSFGDAVGEIFKDPELKQKAKEFSESAAKSAKTFGSRFKDEDVKEKFKDVGKAAENFGKSIADYFKTKKDE
jgi:ribosomal-protein-alanine N-acetyltransferase